MGSPPRSTMAESEASDIRPKLGLWQNINTAIVDAAPVLADRQVVRSQNAASPPQNGNVPEATYNFAFGQLGPQLQELGDKERTELISSRQDTYCEAYPPAFERATSAEDFATNLFEMSRKPIWQHVLKRQIDINLAVLQRLQDFLVQRKKKFIDEHAIQLIGTVTSSPDTERMWLPEEVARIIARNVENEKWSEIIEMEGMLMDQLAKTITEASGSDSFSSRHKGELWIKLSRVRLQAAF